MPSAGSSERLCTSAGWRPPSCSPEDACLFVAICSLKARNHGGIYTQGTPTTWPILLHSLCSLSSWSYFPNPSLSQCCQDTHQPTTATTPDTPLSGAGWPISEHLNQTEVMIITAMVTICKGVSY